MKMKFLSALLIFICCSCNTKNKDCLGQANENVACYEIYKPVCGCDGKTYPNDGYAKKAGVKKYTEGECAKKQ